MTTITCKLPEPLAAQLDAAARASRRSKSALVREALEERFKGSAEFRHPTALDLSQHLRGSLKGGPRDLATNPQHLSGFGE